MPAAHPSKPPPGTLIDWGKPQSAGIVVDFMFAEAAGAATFDGAGRRTATLVGTPTWAGAGLTLNGSTQYANVPYDPAWDLGTADFTMEVKCVPASIGSFQCFMGNFGGGTGNWEFGHSNNAGKLLWWCGGGIYESTAIVAANAPLHAVLVRYNRVVSFYANGVACGTFTDTGTASAGGGVTCLGSRGAGGSPFNGSLELVRVRNYAMTADEVARLAGNPWVPYRRRSLAGLRARSGRLLMLRRRANARAA